MRGLETQLLISMICYLKEFNMFSVIIPAHNEEAVIAKSLKALTSSMQPNEMQIIVACNACKDKTAEIARQFSGVTVLETDIPGKPNALNMADREATCFPRIYLDADILMSTDTARELSRVLSRGDIHAAAPGLKVNLGGRSWLLKAYYAIWTRLPYCTQGMVGSGVYALSEAGRSRFDDFPELLAEDDFIRLLFSPTERMTLPNHNFVISSPTSFSALLNLRRRWERSNRQIDNNFVGMRENDKRDYFPFIKELLCKPVLWPALIVYVYAIMSSRLVAAMQLRFANNPWEWSRDDTAREQMGKD